MSGSRNDLSLAGWVKGTRLLVRLGGLSAFLACQSDHALTGPDRAGNGLPASAIIVSDPVSVPLAGVPPQPQAGGPAGSMNAGDSVVYVSLKPGTVSRGLRVEIRNAATGFTRTDPLVAGGLDPVPVVAGVGDTVELTVTDSAGATKHGAVAVAALALPIIVRTDPPPRKRDVPLNMMMVVVFSEPMSPATVTPLTVQLLRNGQPVGARVLLTTDLLFAAVQPDGLLAPETEYTLLITTALADLGGDRLEDSVVVDFTTAQAPAPAPPFLLAAVSTGGEHTCGRTTAGVAYCWGQGSSGQIGNGTFSISPTPVPVSGGLVFSSISAGGDFTCGLADGAAYCWGSNFVYQLGNGTTSESSIPVPVAGDLTFASIEAGWHHACALTPAGAAYCWGFNRAGGAGDTSGAEPCRDESFNTNPSPCNKAPQLVSGGLAFASLSLGWLHTCGVTVTGEAYCWGYNGSLQLGNGNGTDAYEPVAVAGGRTFASVDAGDLHTCGVAAGGAAYCWGSNLAGELGTRSADGLVYGGLTFTSVTAGFVYTCAVVVARTGPAYCWGNGARGALGNGSLDDTAIPVPVSGDHSFVAVSAGKNPGYPQHTCGVTSSNEVYCWGNGYSGQLGSGAYTYSSAVPVRVRSP